MEHGYAGVKGTRWPVSLCSRRELLTLDSVIAGLIAAPALVSRAAGVASSGTQGVPAMLRRAGLNRDVFLTATDGGTALCQRRSLQRATRLLDVAEAPPACSVQC